MSLRLLGGLLGLLALVQPVSAVGDVDRLLAAAPGQIGVTTTCDPAYVRLAYQRALSLVRGITMT